MSLLLILAAVAASPLSPPCPGGAQVEIIGCAGQAAERGDAELDRQWPLTVEVAREDEANARAQDRNDTPLADLEAAQRAWLAYRDAECASEWNGTGGGADAAVLQNQCHERLTRARIAELKAYTDRP